MKKSLFIYYLFVCVTAGTALPQLGLKYGGGPSTTDFSLWTGGPSSMLRRSEWYYYVDLEIGYPRQNVSLLLDTGSSDIWISAPELCHNCTFNTYNVSASESGVLMNKDLLFYENYGYVVTGFYASDEFNIADATLLNVSFGVVNATTLKSGNPGGILGIGLIGFETIALQTGQPIPNLISQMKAEGVIDSSTYGIYLGGQSYWDTAPGEITFGGYNPTRFSGVLLPLPLAPSPDQFPRLQIWLSSVSVKANGKTEILRPEKQNTLGTSILLDTGSPGSAIPRSMYYQLTEVLGVNPVTNQIDCGYLSSDGGLTFTFYGFDGQYPAIWVPFRQVIKGFVIGGKDVCYFTITPEYDCSRGTTQFSCTTLGEDFLRTAYIYVNYDNSTISIAQANYGNPSSCAGAVEEGQNRIQAPLKLQRFPEGMSVHDL